MTHAQKVMMALVVCGTAFVAYDLWSPSGPGACQLEDSSPAYSPDGKFYYQIRSLRCADSAKSRAELLVGVAGKSDKTVMLELGPQAGLHASWREDRQLHVDVAGSAIRKQYGPYDGLPRVIMDRSPMPGSG